METSHITIENHCEADFEILPKQFKEYNYLRLWDNVWLTTTHKKLQPSEVWTTNHANSTNENDGLMESNRFFVGNVA